MLPSACLGGRLLKTGAEEEEGQEGQGCTQGRHECFHAILPGEPRSGNELYSHTENSKTRPAFVVHTSLKRRLALFLSSVLPSRDRTPKNQFRKDPDITAHTRKSCTNFGRVG